MVTIEDAIYNRLSTFSSLITLVADRIHPLVLPQNTAYPAITYSKVSGVRETAMVVDPGVAHPVFQFSCWDLSYSAAKDVKEQVRIALERYSGIYNGVEILDAYVINETDLYDPTIEVAQITLDMEVWHRE